MKNCQQRILPLKAAEGVYLRFKANTTTNELEIVVPKGTVKDTYVPEVKVKVSDVQNFTLKPSITVEVTDADYTLTYDDKIITGGSSLALTANLLPADKPTSMNFMMESLLSLRTMQRLWTMLRR